ncbi:hypothetical protein [Aquibacillus halophilus]|nr:hypothetical protein [Aquibacillus halophilus]
MKSQLLKFVELNYASFDLICLPFIIVADMMMTARSANQHSS